MQLCLLSPTWQGFLYPRGYWRLDCIPWVLWDSPLRVQHYYQILPSLWPQAYSVSASFCPTSFTQPSKSHDGSPSPSVSHAPFRSVWLVLTHLACPSHIPFTYLIFESWVWWCKPITPGKCHRRTEVRTRWALQRPCFKTSQNGWDYRLKNTCTSCLMPWVQPPAYRVGWRKDAFMFHILRTGDSTEN